MKTAEEIIHKKNMSIISVGPDVTIDEALRVMVENNIGAILVKENDQIIGIWTERDLMRNTIQKGFNPKISLIKEYMVTELISASYDEPIYKLQDKFLGRRLRHLLIEKNGVFIGLLSAGDVTRADLMEKSEVLKALNKFCSWDYYENWKWRK